MVKRSKKNEETEGNSCNYCGKELDILPFVCKFCGGNFCSEHRVPETHNCLGIEEYKKNQIKKFTEGKAPITYGEESRKDTERKDFIPSFTTNFPKFRNSFRKPFFKTRYHSEYVDSLIWIGLIICFISLFLPWLTLSGFGPFSGALQASWFNLVQTEIPKIQTEGIIAYISSSNYILIDVTVLPMIGLGIIVIGLFTRKNWIIFAGSFFMLISSFVLLYFLNQGISAFGLQVNLIFLAGIGMWGFLFGSILVTYGSGKHMSVASVFPSIIIVSIIAALMLSNFSFPFKLNISSFTNIATSSYPTDEAKVMVQGVIRNYLNPSNVAGGSISLLTMFGPSFQGQSFDGYSVCAAGTYACNYGKNQGENLNYLYCGPTFLSQYIFCYKKTITTSTGEIQQVIRNCVNDFVFDPISLQVISIDFGPLSQTAESLC